MAFRGVTPYQRGAILFVGPVLELCLEVGCCEVYAAWHEGQPYITRPVLRFPLDFKRLQGTFYDFPREDLARVDSSPFVECTALVFLDRFPEGLVFAFPKLVIIVAILVAGIDTGIALVLPRPTQYAGLASGKLSAFEF